MIRYELKKIFCTKGSRICLLVLAAALFTVIWFAVGETAWIDEDGTAQTGPAAIRRLREAENEWAGDLTEEKLAEVISLSLQLKPEPSGSEEEGRKQDILLGRRQGFENIRMLLNSSFTGFHEYDAYRSNTLVPQQAGEFYDNRTRQLREWLAGEESYYFKDWEKAYFLARYEAMETPLRYSFHKGWKALGEYSQTAAGITAVVVCLMLVPLFTGEFRLKADSVFYSSLHGRGKAASAKVWAGLLTLTIFSADGWDCRIQLDRWKSFYNLTFLQEYLLVTAAGYIGCLFAGALTMFAAAKTRSTVFSTSVIFLLLLLPGFIPGLSAGLPAGIQKILLLLPDRLFMLHEQFSYFQVYRIGGKVVTFVALLLPVYLILSLLLLPLAYRAMRRKGKSIP